MRRAVVASAALALGLAACTVEHYRLEVARDSVARGRPAPGRPPVFLVVPPAPEGAPLDAPPEGKAPPPGGGWAWHPVWGWGYFPPKRP